ncbi:MAG TPA: polyprenyl diphosphate synthase [Rhodocyclaceae bacterium]|jgi:undecaprenyl diphosphate synthase|nr:polyprenyl diphosphate synthase [Rhodocyclaceae bacterium]
MALFGSSTKEVPQTADVPRHVAVIMDGNGRWAKKRMMPRVAGHVRGVEAVRGTVAACIERGIGYLTLFAFSSENWRRPADEVGFLMKLFVKSLKDEAEKLNRAGVCLRIVGDLSRFDVELQQAITDVEALTAKNNTLTLTIAANYGGRWDIMQALNRLSVEQPERAGRFTEEDIAARSVMAHAPEPDLFIRTGGEQRISNFLLWQLAYTELYFTDKLWPEFDAAMLDEAILSFNKRERRFGRTSEQLIGSVEPMTQSDA